MTPEQVNTLIDGVAADKFERPFRCGTAPFSSCSTVAASASASCRVESGRCGSRRAMAARAWQGAQGTAGAAAGQAAGALERYLGDRPWRVKSAVFLNHRGQRLTARGIRGIVNSTPPS